MTSARGPYAKSAERRAAIVDAAFAVFAANGYRGGSLQQVADAVGMSQTSLLYYFRAKGDLLQAVLERRDAVAAERAAGTAGSDDLVDRVVAQAEANAEVPGLIALYAVLAGEAVTDGNPGRPHVADRFARLRDEFGADFRRLAEAGRLRDGVDPDAAAAGLVALWDGLQLQWLLAPDAVDVPGGLRAHLDLVVLPAPPDARPRPSGHAGASAPGSDASPEGTNR